MNCQAYLNEYGFVSRAPRFLRRSWDHMVVVPLAGEPDGGRGCLEALERAAAHSRAEVLAVWILNGRAPIPRSYQIGNETTRRLVGGTPHAVGWQLARHGALTVALWDWASERCFGPEDGVGRARRMGADLAAALHAEGWLRSPFVLTTDADARVPDNYFTARPGRRLGGSDEGETVGVFPFSHPSDRAHQLYDLYLRYHPAGLDHAGSPYAFPTIGSTLCIPIEAYCQARGFPQRLAGEDFHLLNKLAKMCPVHEMETSPIVLSGRPSDRVPFGTGPATSRLQQRSLLLDDPRIYTVLGTLLKWARSASSNREDLRGTMREQHGERIGQWVWEGSKAAIRAMDTAWDTRTTEGDRWRHWWTHFDGLKTYQWVRRMREILPPLHWRDALAQAPFRARVGRTPETGDVDSYPGTLPHAAEAGEMMESPLG